VLEEEEGFVLLAAWPRVPIASASSAEAALSLSRKRNPVPKKAMAEEKKEEHPLQNGTTE
jgi:hypothetical protein